jgi:prepilin signal peptidase PulO-like enzyme (type II secretory pathway)
MSAAASAQRGPFARLFSLPAIVLLVLGTMGLVGVAVKQPPPERAVVGLVYVALLAWIAMEDARSLRARNQVVYPAFGVVALVALAFGWPTAAEAISGGIVALAVMLLLAAVGRGALGMGDVKVAALCGMIVGFHGVFPMLLIAFIGGGAAGLLLLALRMRGRRDVIPFTPFLAGSTLACLSFYRLYLWS